MLTELVVEFQSFELMDFFEEFDQWMRMENRHFKYTIPLDLIFCEFYLFKVDALKREKYFKTDEAEKFTPEA